MKDINTETWRPCDTMENFATAISEYNKMKEKKDILMNYTIRGFCVMENFELHFPKEMKLKRNRRFIIKYHYAKNFFERLLSLFKRQQGYYEIYTEQEGF